MITLGNWVGPVFAWLLRVSGQAAVLIVLMLLVQALFGNRLAPRWRHGLWLLVVVRLLLPVQFASSFSIFNLVPPRPPARVLNGLPPTPAESTLARRAGLPVTPPASVASSAQTPARLTPREPAAATSSMQIIPRAKVPWSWWTWAALIWLVGAAGLGLRIIWQNILFYRRLRWESTVTNSQAWEVLEECRLLMGVRYRLVLMETNFVHSPALYGFWRLQLLLPEKTLAVFSPQELRYVFLHELAHVKRRDMLVNWFLTVLQVVHWFNPLIWLAFRRMVTERELAADALALSCLEAQENKAYGQAIIKLLQNLLSPASLPGLVGILEDKNQMKRRMSMIATFKKTNRWSVLAIALLMALGLVTLTDAQSKTGSSQPASIPETGDVIDSTNGLKYVVAKTIPGTNDLIEDNSVTLSLNGKFLLWWGRVVPLDGSPAFKLKELKGAGIASWSPDGQKIAFNSEGIQVLPVSPETGRPTSAARKLMEGKEDWFRGKIYWSADSERILFVKWNREMQREVGSIALRDSRLNKQPNCADFGLLSPDGKTIAYSLPQDGIWAKSVGGGASRILRPRTGGWLFDDPALWTSDSQWVVSVVQGWTQEEIHLTRLSDRRSFDVFPPEVAGTFVGRSSDGKKLLFYRPSSVLRAKTKVVPISGEPALSVGQSIGFEELENHSWTSDSATLAVLGLDKEGQQLWSVPLTGGERVRFKMESLGTNVLYLWSMSQDSKRVLYVASPGPDQGTKGLDLYIAPISLKDGQATGPATLVFKGWQNPLPNVGIKLGAWSPDGTKIALPHKSDQGYELWVLFADGGQRIQITQTPDPLNQNPLWSPDGKMVAFNLRASDHEMLQVIPAAGGTAKTVLTTPKGQLGPYCWSADSKAIVVARDGSISGSSVTDGSARVIVRLHDLGCESVAWLGWSPNGQGLAFYGRKRGEASRLFLFSPRTDKITTLDNCPSAAWDFAWSPDSKMISCTAEEADKARPAGVLRELDVAEAMQKAPPVGESKPTAATTAPQVEPITGPVFTDNFDNGPSKHWRFQDLPDVGWGPGRHAVEKGELSLTHARARLDGIDWTNYIVTVRVCMKEVMDPADGSLGIAVRSTPSGFGSSKRDVYALGVFGDNEARRYLWLGINYVDASDTLRHGELSRSPCRLVLDKWYTLEFEVRGQLLRGFLDGKLMVEANDARLSTGRLWIGASRARALFDDFSVRQLP